MAKKEVAKKANTEVAEFDDDILADAESGDHGFTRNDLTLPFIRILQKLSPELDKKKGVYIEGADEGDFFNPATGEFYSGQDGIFFVPVVYTINYTEWKPREQGGGLIADHGSDAAILQTTTRDDKNRAMTQNGTNINTAGLYFGFLVDLETGDSQQAIIPMSSTQLKKSRSWNSMIANYRVEVNTKESPRRINPRMWFHVFKLTTVPESNDSGDWMGYKVEREGGVRDYPWGSECYTAGRELAELFAKGEVKMRADDLAGDGDHASQGKREGPAPGPSDGDDEEIPF